MPQFQGQCYLLLSVLNQSELTFNLSIFRDTSGQGRFCTIFRSYSRGAQVRRLQIDWIEKKKTAGSKPAQLVSPQGILLVYDITNRWSFDGIDRWIREIDEVSVGVGWMAR